MPGCLGHPDRVKAKLGVEIVCVFARSERGYSRLMYNASLMEDERKGIMMGSGDISSEVKFGGGTY